MSDLFSVTRRLQDRVAVAEAGQCQRYAQQHPQTVSHPSDAWSSLLTVVGAGSGGVEHML